MTAMGDHDDKKKGLVEFSGMALQDAAPTGSSQLSWFDQYRENYGVWAALMQCTMESHGL
jgi:hypothetical protein